MKKVKDLSFGEAIDHLKVPQRKIFRSEWPKNNYGFVNTKNNLLSLSLNGEIHEWLVSTGDILANDWNVI